MQVRPLQREELQSKLKPLKEKFLKAIQSLGSSNVLPDLIEKLKVLLKNFDIDVDKWEDMIQTVIKGEPFDRFEPEFMENDWVTFKAECIKIQEAIKKSKEGDSKKEIETELINLLKESKVRDDKIEECKKNFFDKDESKLGEILMQVRPVQRLELQSKLNTLRERISKYNLPKPVEKFTLQLKQSLARCNIDEDLGERIIGTVLAGKSIDSFEGEFVPDDWKEFKNECNMIQQSISGKQNQPGPSPQKLSAQENLKKSNDS